MSDVFLTPDSTYRNKAGKHHRGYAANIALAKEKYVKLVIMALIGREKPDILADSEFNEEGTKLLKCAAGYESVSQNRIRSIRQCRVLFDRNHCAGYPYREQCCSKIHKKVADLTTQKIHLTE